MRRSNIIFAIIFYILMSSHLMGQISFVVNAKTSSWQGTGLNRGANKICMIIGKGTYSNGGETYRADTWSSPDGNGNHDSAWVSVNYLVNTANPLCLVGKIGESGVPFGIGTYKLIPDSYADTGEIFLAINDNFYDDNYGYLVAIVNLYDKLSGVEDKLIQPTKFNLSQNYPNPFNPNTTIKYQIPKQSNVEVGIYDINGRLVRNLVNETQHPGSYTLQWNGRDTAGINVSSGTYFYQVKSNGSQLVKKMLLLK